VQDPVKFVGDLHHWRVTAFVDKMQFAVGNQALEFLCPSRTKSFGTIGEFFDTMKR
jgi:hypothetical protein